MDDKVKIRSALGCLLSSLTLGAALSTASLAAAAIDHDEYDATLHVPYIGHPGERRELTLTFVYPGQPKDVTVAWRVEIRDDQNTLVRSWSGQALAGDVVKTARISWDGTDERGDALPDGNYEASLFTSPGDAGDLAVALAAADVVDGPALMGEPPIIQTWPLRVGRVFPVEMPSFAPLPSASRSLVAKSSPAAADLPYTVYYANLHSQTNHSDGGGVIGTCTGAQNPQSGAFDPADAFVYAYGHGLDALMASEHNHMYDGSNSTNAGADPAVAQALYQSGLQQASSFTQGHPGFLALYGMEWGVISNGGHLNIFGSNELYSWEYNGIGQLIGDLYTPKSDYAALYETLRSQNALGQFNHPATSGQFSGGWRGSWLRRQWQCGHGSCGGAEQLSLLLEHHRNRKQPNLLRRSVEEALGTGLPRRAQLQSGQPLRQLGSELLESHRCPAANRLAIVDRILHGGAAGPPRVRHDGQDRATNSHITG